MLDSDSKKKECYGRNYLIIEPTFVQETTASEFLFITFEMLNNRNSLKLSLLYSRKSATANLSCLTNLLRITGYKYHHSLVIYHKELHDYKTMVQQYL